MIYSFYCENVLSAFMFVKLVVHKQENNNCVDVARHIILKQTRKLLFSDS